MMERMPTGIYRGRYTAEMSDDFVVFLIGMRLNRPWKVHKWLPVFVAMPRMLRWLDEHPEAGLLGWHNAWIKGPAVVEYWRSFEDLERFARATEQPHLPAWKVFNHAVRASGDVGIWHETFKVRAGEYESIYGNMPRIGLAAAARHVPVGSAAQSAARRIGATDIDQPALVPYALFVNVECLDVLLGTLHSRCTFEHLIEAARHWLTA